MAESDATWQDLIELIALAQNRVLEQFSLTLEPEVRIIKIA